jgi:hypothetical protein
MNSDEPVRIKLPPRVRLLGTANHQEHYATLPIEATENLSWALREAIGLLVILIALGLSVMSRQHINLFSAGIALALSLAFGTGAFLAFKKSRNGVRLGPAHLRISKSGLSISNLTLGELPWSEIDVVYPKFANGRLEAIELKLKSRAFLLGNDAPDGAPDIGDKVLIAIKLRYYPDQNKLGEVIIAAANHFCKSHSAWGGLPPGMNSL